MTRDDFPILRKHSSNVRGFDESLERVLDGIQAGGIRNAVFVDCKYDLSSAIYSAWSAHVQEPFFHAGRYEKLPKALQEFDWTLTVSNLHDVIAASKRIQKSALTGPAMDAMREFMREALPLSLAAASLKDKLIMGRAPSTGVAKDQNQNKVVKTCACCFRPIAVVKSLMAHHGYTRPGHGNQTASCPGIRFRPLEVSKDGLVYILELVRGEHAANQDALATLPQRTSIHVLKRIDGRRALVEVKKGEPSWNREHASLRCDLIYSKGRLERDLAKLEPMLRDWKQVDFPDASSDEIVADTSPVDVEPDATPQYPRER